MTNRGRWSSNPVRRWCCPDRFQWRLSHTWAGPDGSTPERNRRRFASHEPRSHRPKLIWKPCHGDRYDRACCSLHGGCFDVAQTLSICQLGEGESKELIPARKSAEFMIAVITIHAFLK